MDKSITSTMTKKERLELAMTINLSEVRKISKRNKEIAKLLQENRLVRNTQVYVDTLKSKAEYRIERVGKRIKSILKNNPDARRRIVPNVPVYVGKTLVKPLPMSVVSLLKKEYGSNVDKLIKLREKRYVIDEAITGKPALRKKVKTVKSLKAKVSKPKTTVKRKVASTKV